MSPFHLFCNILDRISSLVHVNEKFCNKNLFLDLFSVVLIVSQILTACKICIKAVVLNKMHWERVGGAGNAKRIGYCLFSGLCHDIDFSIATDFFGPMSQQRNFVSRQVLSRPCTFGSR